MEQNNIQAAIDAGKQINTGKAFEINGHHLIVVPDGMTVRELDDINPFIHHTKATVKTDSAASFIEYFNRFSDDKSAVFMSGDGIYTGIIDYHSETNPDWCDHKVLFNPVKTEEWHKWLSLNGNKFDQEEFAYFIEDCAEEIINPPAAEMLEIATTLKAKTKIDFSSGKNLANGQTQLTYNEVIDGAAGPKGELKIPEKIVIGMRLYKGGEAYKMEARFRYRIREGKIALWYDIIRPQKTIDSALEDMTTVIKGQVKNQLFINGDY